MALINDGLPGAYIFQATADMISPRYIGNAPVPCGPLKADAVDMDATSTWVLPGDLLVAARTEDDEQVAAVGNLNAGNADVTVDTSTGLYAGSWPMLPSMIRGPETDQPGGGYSWAVNVRTAVVDHNGHLGFGVGAAVFPATNIDESRTFLIRTADGNVAEAGPFPDVGDSVVGQPHITAWGLLVVVHGKTSDTLEWWRTNNTVGIFRWTLGGGWALVGNTAFYSADFSQYAPNDVVLIQRFVPTLHDAGDYLLITATTLTKQQNATNPDFTDYNYGVRVWTVHPTGEFVNFTDAAIVPAAGHTVDATQFGDELYNARVYANRFHIWFVVPGRGFLYYTRNSVILQAYAYHSPFLTEPGTLLPPRGEYYSPGWVDDAGVLHVLTRYAQVVDEYGGTYNTGDDQGCLTSHPITGTPSTVRLWFREDLGIRLLPNVDTAVVATPGVHVDDNGGLLVVSSAPHYWVAAVTADGTTKPLWWCRERSPASWNLWNFYLTIPHLVAAPDGNVGLLPL